MAYFPLYIELENKKCIVVGGGKVAAGKVRQLLSFGGNVTVIAPELAGELAQLAAEGQIVWKQGVFPMEEVKEEDFADCALVVAATDQKDVNARVSKLCRIHGIPVNVVDVKELCTFFFPAIVKRQDVVVAVSTSGKSPALAARLRRELETEIPESYGMAADILGACREEVLERVPDIRERKRLFEALLTQLLGEENAEDR